MYKKDLGNNWQEYEFWGIKIQAKVYSVGSKYGICGGKISKLWVKLWGIVTINYDRGDWWLQ